ncbi:hypothetical protein BGX31_001775, partial [Mortierella sp. GBA43]
MFTIPEIDEQICAQLNRSDLATCARVSKTWHGIVIPHIWRSIHLVPVISIGSTITLCSIGTEDEQRRVMLFRGVILEDFMRTSQDEGNHMDHRSQAGSSSVSTLSKYGPLIRDMLPFDGLVTILGPSQVEEERKDVADVKSQRPLSFLVTSSSIVQT